MERKHESQPHNVLVRTVLGELRISFEDGGERIRINDGRARTENKLTVDGDQYRVQAVLVVNPAGGYQTARTDAGNEAGHGLEVTHLDGPKAAKRVRDLVRETVVNTVSMFVRQEGQELLVQARRAHLNNEVMNAERAVERARAALAAAESALTKAEAREAGFLAATNNATQEVR